MTIIFLDIDGVVTSARDNGFRDFNPYVVRWLRFCCAESGAKIVISSTWRHGYGREFWQSIFGDAMHEDWRTPDGTRRQESNGFWMSPIRGEEIATWLAEHPEVPQYFILDDDSDFLESQKPFHIKTDPMNGMLFDHMMRLKEGLGISRFPGLEVEPFTHPNMYGITRRGNI